jgi:tripartite ATP-independent transporter DctM subunit
MTGIMGGEIVMLGLIALPQMLRLGYDRKLAMGTICAGGSLATLIPPSIIMIVYGLTAQVGIGDLFLAGAIPGLLLAGLYIAYIMIRCRLNPALAPLAPLEMRQMPRAEKLRAMRGLVLPMAVIVWVLGSIYGGIASVTEAAGVGVIGAALAALARNRLSWSMIQASLRQTMVTVGTIIWLILGAVSLVGIYNIIGGNSYMQQLLSGLDLPPLGVILVMMLILVILGTFMEWIAIVFITVPIFAPVVTSLGFDPIWFGVLFVMNMQVYFLSPPFGPACFWLKSVAPPDVTLQEIFASVWPFIGLQLVGLILVMFFPQIALWLPSVVFG